MSITKHKGDKAHIQVGEFECVIDKYGCMVNPPIITQWTRRNVQEYIKFLRKLLGYLDV